METNPQKRVTRIYQCELRALENEDYGTYIAGTPIVFSAEADLGYFKEIIDRGALDGTDLRDVPLFVNHNMDMIPLARSRRNNANSTMQLTPHEDGMDFRANLDVENNATAKELYSAIKRGDLDKMSFAFTIDKEEWEDLDSDYPTRHIKSISKVYEISAVNFPAYNQTSIYASRSEDKEALDNARHLVETKRAEERKAKIEEIRNILKEL